MSKKLKIMVVRKESLVEDITKVLDKKDTGVIMRVTSINGNLVLKLVKVKDIYHIVNLTTGYNNAVYELNTVHQVTKFIDKEFNVTLDNIDMYSYKGFKGLMKFFKRFYTIEYKITEDDITADPHSMAKQLARLLLDTLTTNDIKHVHLVTGTKWVILGVKKIGDHVLIVYNNHKKISKTVEAEFEYEALTNTFFRIIAK